MNHTHPAFMPKVIGHRGAAGSAPENTLAAIVQAAALGAKAVELDVTVSRDGVPVLMHDEDVNRCSDGEGLVVRQDFETLHRLDVGAWFGARFGGERIATLEDALALIAAKGLRLNLELKPAIGWEEPTVRAVAEVVRRAWTGDVPILVSSFNPLALTVYRDLMPGAVLGLITTAVAENWHQRLRQHHCASFHCHHDFVTRQLVQDAHAAGVRLHVYTVNEAARAQTLFAMGVDAVFSDHPDRILAVVRT